MPNERSIADRLFDADYASAELEDQLDNVPFDRMGWDNYDCSLELYEVDDDYRLPVEMQKVIFDAGFFKVYVNHKNKWETHYSWSHGKGFVEAKGWRVSYPHKRGEEGGPILVEAIVPSWPKKWFEAGHAVVKSVLSK
jgi:hypothetical protein